VTPDPHHLGPLLDRARGGDRAAWNDLLQRLRPFICLLARRTLRDELEASDLAQEALLRMDRGFAQFRGEQPAQLIAWVRRIVARLVFDRAANRPPRPVELPELPDSDSGAAGARLLREEEMARLAAALEELPADYRTVIEARLFDGRKCLDIASDLGRTPEWVRVTCLRAVQRLRERLQTS
jgi:RNA polymerase sigma-70 factor (ECF subfamily)